MPAQAIDPLLRYVDQAFDRRSWHGPNLIGALRGVKPDLAIWRPHEGRHNIAELAIHAAYWKYRVVRLICDEPPPSFQLAGSNFIARNPPYAAREWKADRDLLISWHRRFRATVASLAGSRLREVVTNSFTVEEAVAGVAAHDLYHAGQIQLLKRLHDSR